MLDDTVGGAFSIILPRRTKELKIGSNFLVLILNAQVIKFSGTEKNGLREDLPVKQAPKAGGCVTGDRGDRGNMGDRADREHRGDRGHRWHRADWVNSFNET